SEQHRDLLALAFKRGLGGEDLLDEMLRGVGLGRSEARLGRGGDLFFESGPTAVAEPTAGWTDVVTGMARELEARAAPLQKRAPLGLSCWQYLRGGQCRA